MQAIRVLGANQGHLYLQKLMHVKHCLILSFTPFFPNTPMCCHNLGTVILLLWDGRNVTATVPGTPFVMSLTPAPSLLSLAFDHQRFFSRIQCEAVALVAADSVAAIAVVLHPGLSAILVVPLDRVWRSFPTFAVTYNLQRSTGLRSVT